MVQLVMSDAVREKLQVKHKVEPEEIMQGFLNRERGFLEDKREEHKTDPPTQWFISKTDSGRLLKILFVQTSPKEIEIKTAYEPNIIEINIYTTYAQKLTI